MTETARGAAFEKILNFRVAASSWIFEGAEDLDFQSPQTHIGTRDRQG
jgi:hypothetical protein